MTYSQALSPLFSSGTRTCTLERRTRFAAKVLQHAADAGERSTILPDLGQHIVQPKKMPVPLAGDFALVLDGLNRLQQPLQGTHGHVVANVLGDVGEVQHRPFRDEAEDVLRVVTGLEVFVIRKPKALVLEVVSDAAGPDRILVGILRKLLAEVTVEDRPSRCG